MRTILITGGSGYLGSELVRRAASGGWRVCATYLSQRPEADGATFVPLDLADAQQVERLIAGLRPAAVVHTACRQAEPGLHEVTALGAQAVAWAARRHAACLVHISSDAVFDGEREAAYREADAPNPLTPYGAAKAEAERLVAQADPAALIVRTSLIYGGTRLSKHEQVVLDALDGRADITFFTDEIRCPVNVTDLALALLELVERPAAGVLHIAGADAVSRHTFAQLVARAHGRDPSGLRSGTVAASGLRRPRTCVLDSSVAQRMLATRLRGVREALASGPPHR